MNLGKRSGNDIYLEGIQNVESEEEIKLHLEKDRIKVSIFYES